MNNLTRLFLIVLRLAIGWLFLAEGVEKVQSMQRGPTVDGKPFSSAGYLKQSSGPLAPFFQWQAGGDADAHALDCLTVDPDATRLPRDRASAALRADWDAYLDRFADHYGLDGDQRQAARAKLDASLDAAVAWIIDNSHRKELDKVTAFPGAAYAPRKTPTERIAEYRDKVAEYRQAQDEVNARFNSDVYRAKLRTMKADAARMRTDLMTDLDAPMHAGLESVLTADQKKLPALGPPPPPAVLVWTDRLVSWGLVVIGAGLMLGVFTRLNCLGGAVFLIVLYLAMPPMPWSPENLKSETPDIPYINKNLIMALALLALAATRSGMWFGLDGLLQYLNPWTYRARKARAEAEPATA
jgi:uncharacterized membrane protein YphA (DoxX/SURF4 family)